MNILWLVCGALTVLYPITRNELFKYHHAQHECWNQQAANNELLRSKICMDPVKRLQFKSAGTVDCDKAERELRLTSAQCAFQLWWSQSAIIDLYTKLTHSYWTLLGLILPLCMWSMYLVFKYIRETRSEERFYEKQEHFIKAITQKKEKKQRPTIGPTIDVEFVRKKIKHK